MAKLNKSRKFIATSATAALVASAIVPVASAAQINDFNSISSYAQEAVQDLNDRGVIKGDQKGNFNPRNNVTRAEAATILTNALGLEGSGSTSFNDVNKSAWYYDAIDAAVANGIFQGQGAGKFNPSGNLTRSEAAIILVDAFGLEGSADLSEFKDSASVKTWAQEALEIAVANGVMKGDAGNLKPNAAISRQDFAVMYHRTEALEVKEEVASGSVKAINNTTVEVTLDEEIGNVEDYKFTIAGLDVKNVAAKQSNKNTLVLTTAVQEGGKEYVVTLNGEEIGKFTGVSAVLPTAIDMVEKSQQNVLGNQVTVKAKVTVATGDSAAGIPVTFNIVNNNSLNNASLNQPIVAEAKTDENGVATYTYTRYASTAHDLVTNDEVQAYATGKATVRSFGKVYWGAIQPLTITEVTTGASINNGAAKQYKVKLAGVNTVGNTVNVAFKENLNILPDKAVKSITVTDSNGRDLGYPGQYVTTAGDQITSTSGYKVVTLNLDAKGETTFTLTGSNATVTPIVFKDAYVNTTNTDPSFGRFDETELFAAAPAVTFAKVQSLALAVENIGTANAAAAKDSAALASLSALVGSATPVESTDLPANTGGRDYKATLKNPDGSTVVSRTPVKVSVNYGTARNTENKNAVVYLYDFNAEKVVRVTANTADDRFEYTLLTDTKGQVSFKLLGEVDSYATPTFFVDTGDKTGLDKNDLQQAGETVYFGDAVVNKAKLAGKDRVVHDETEFVFTTVDQNDNEYLSSSVASIGGLVVNFTVETEGNIATVSQGTGTPVSGVVLPATVNQGSAKTYAIQVPVNGTKASIKVNANNGTKVKVTATAGSFGSSSQTVTFSKLNNEGIADGQEVRGKVLAIDKANNQILITDSKGEQVYELAYGVNELYYQGTKVTEATFENTSGTGTANLKVGQELHFKQKNGEVAAQFNNLGHLSGLDTSTASSKLKTINIYGEGTAKVDTYDFEGTTVNANFQIHGDKVELKNATINGNVTVGKLNATVTEVLNDFALNGVIVNGTVTVNEGDGETFTLTNSQINRVVLNIQEHIDLVDAASSIDVVEVNANGSYFTGTGTVTTAILAANVTLDTTKTGYKAPTNVVPATEATTPFSVATTSGDTSSVTLTFTANVTTSDVAVIEVLANGTTADTATVATTTSAKELVVSFAGTTAVTTKKFEVTYKGLVYTVAYNATTNAWTVTRKQ